MPTTPMPYQVPDFLVSQALAWSCKFLLLSQARMCGLRLVYGLIASAEMFCQWIASTQHREHRSHKKCMYARKGWKRQTGCLRVICDGRAVRCQRLKGSGFETLVFVAQYKYCQIRTLDSPIIQEYEIIGSFQSVPLINDAGFDQTHADGGNVARCPT